ncbi:MAG TPA: hypothetical protein VF119_02450 [Candidatus Limnocylindrales bacterium]
MTDDLQRPADDRPDPGPERVPIPDSLDHEAEGAKVPLREHVWEREGADAPDAADIEDPERQL